MSKTFAIVGLGLLIFGVILGLAPDVEPDQVLLQLKGADSIDVGVETDFHLDIVNPLNQQIRVVGMTHC